MNGKISLVKMKFNVPNRAMKVFEHLEQHQSQWGLWLRTEKVQLKGSRGSSRAVQDVLSVF